MRFSVTSNSRVRFSSPGQMRRWLTEKRILPKLLTKRRILA